MNSNRFFHRFFLPLGRLLIRLKLAYPDVAEQVKHAMVLAAVEKCEQEGKRPSTLEVGRRTGIYRREVARLRKIEVDPTPPLPAVEDTTGAALSRILENWFHEPEYLDQNGKPLPLPVFGPGPSLESMVRSVHSNSDTDKMLHLLESHADLERLADGRIVPSQQIIIWDRDKTDTADRDAAMVGRYINTMVHNIDKGGRGGGFVERRVWSPIFPAEMLVALQQFVRRFANALTYEVDEWVHSHQDPFAPDLKHVGVCIYYYEEDAHPESVLAWQTSSPEAEAQTKLRRRAWSEMPLRTTGMSNM